MLAIVHDRPGRLRLRGEPARVRRMGAALLESLRGLPGLRGAECSLTSGSLLVVYDAAVLDRGAILRPLAAAVARWLDGASGNGDSPGAAALLPRQARSPKAPGCESGPEDSHGPKGLGALLAPTLARPFLPRGFGQIMAVKNALPRLWNGLKALLAGRLNVDVLDATAIGVCVLRRDFGSLSTITLLLGLGEFLESWTRKRSEESLADTLSSQKVWARVRDGDLEIEVDSTQVREGQEVVIRSGALIPVDGLVIEGEALADQSSMTGEARLIQKRPGSAVFAGTILTEGELVVRTTTAGDKTRWRRTLTLVRDAERRKAAIQSQAERLAGKLVPASLGVAALTYAVTRDPRRASAALMVDYSCAIKLATPLTVLTAMRQLAERGVVVKGGKHLEDLAKADVFIFDKTGTLTNAEPSVREVTAFGGWTRDEVLRLAACLEEHFPHPVARAVVRQAEAEGLEHREEHASVEYVLAHGIASRLNGERVLLGSRHFIHEDEGVDLGEGGQCSLEWAEQGASVLYLAVGGALAGCIALDDPVRPEAAAALAALRELGVKRIIMLTGDLDGAAAKVAAELGVTEWISQALPDDKHRVVEELRAKGHVVAMVGDGLNDAAALARADVGVCMRQGADVAREASDIELAVGDLTLLPVARLIAQGALERIRFNYGLIVSVNSLLLAGGLLGRVPPALGAVLHNLATVAAGVNALRPMAISPTGGRR